MQSAQIIVVDDDAGMLRAVERILGADHHVTCFASGHEALLALGALRPDLAICDISMPKMDGFELMEQLKQRRPDLDVILMTGMAEPDEHLVRAIRTKAFYFVEKPFNRQVMRTLVERCLELQRLREAEQAHARRIGRELQEARVLQQAMLPPPCTDHNGIRVAARCVACSELGGDFFDYAGAGPRRLAVVVADVAGHGVSAAMLTSIVKTSFRSSAGEAYDPMVVVLRVAEGIRAFGYDRFITLVCARIDAHAGSIEYVGAGHPPGLLWRPDQPQRDVRALESTGPMISPAFDRPAWERAFAEMTPADRLLLYTDGIAEVQRADDAPIHGGFETFGAARLVAALQSSAQRADGDEVLENVLAAARAFAGNCAQADDLTLLTASFDARPSPPA